MAHELMIWNSSLLAAADLSAKQYFAVKITAADTINLSGAGENAIGILQNKPTSGQTATVMVMGESMAMYGDTVTAGANLMANASGKLVPATGTNAVIAVAREAGAVDEIHTVFLVTRSTAGVNTKAIFSYYVPLAGLVTGDILTTYTPGFAGTITKVSAAVVTATTDIDADATINLEIGTTNLTGGVVTLSDANVTPKGAVIDGTAVTAANVFTAVDTISIEAVVTNAFSDGAIMVLVVIE